MSFLLSHLKGMSAVLVAGAAVVAGWTDLKNDLGDVQDKVDTHEVYINSDSSATARIDERTKVMLEQLDRIERRISSK